VKEYRCAICGKLIEIEATENGASVGEYDWDVSRLCATCEKKVNESD
jgi:DNA-directed RNA polymerase subunit RPC12/RpoP